MWEIAHAFLFEGESGAWLRLKKKKWQREGNLLALRRGGAGEIKMDARSGLQLRGEVVNWIFVKLGSKCLVWYWFC